jgi:hypothetical protein
VILQRHHGSGDGDITANFFGIVVSDGVAVSVLAHTINGSGHVKQALSQSGLAAATVTEQTNITDSVNSVHGMFNLLSGRVPGTAIKTLYTKGV